MYASLGRFPPPLLLITEVILTGHTYRDPPTFTGIKVIETGARDKPRPRRRGRRPATASPAAGGTAPRGGLGSRARFCLGGSVAAARHPPGERAAPGKARRWPAKPKPPGPGGGAYEAASPHLAAARESGSLRAATSTHLGSAQRGLPHPPCPAPRPHAPSRLSPCLPSAPAASGFLQRRWGGGAAEAPPRPAPPSRPSPSPPGGGRRGAEARRGEAGSGWRGRAALLGEVGSGGGGGSSREGIVKQGNIWETSRSGSRMFRKNGRSGYFSWCDVQNELRPVPARISAVIFLLRNRFSGGSAPSLPSDHQQLHLPWEPPLTALWGGSQRKCFPAPVNFSQFHPI